MLFKDVTNFQTLQTWLGHNATCYYNLNMFIHALLYIVCEICLILGYCNKLPLVTILFPRKLSVDFL